MTLRQMALTIFGLSAIAAAFIAVFGVGFTSSAACGWGWGEDHKRIQARFLRGEFKEPLSDWLVISSFTCTGFQDLEVTAELLMPYPDGLTLLSELEKTYLEPQNGKYLEDASKEKLLTTFPDKKRYRYTLPGNGILYVRKLEVFIPDDTSKPVSVTFEGFQM